MNFLNFSIKNNIPIFTDGTSELRFIKSQNENIIVNHSAFLQNFTDDAELILQFGNAPASQSVLRYLEDTKAKKILINKFGDLKDPSKSKPLVVENDPVQFLQFLKTQNFNPENKIDWLKKVIKLDKKSEFIKNSFLQKPKINLEPFWPNEFLKVIPNNSNLFISNSLPIRDFDYFASKKKSSIKVFTNRGASGIDGIISTASGIAAQSKENTFLIIGDLAFYHNISALSTLAEINISLKIILLNNNGGGIFNMLPVANEKNNFEEYFITSQNLDFQKIVKAFGVKYYNPKSWQSFQQNLNSELKSKNSCVIEIKTDAKKSVELRKKYWSEIEKFLNSPNDIKNLQSFHKH